MRIQALTKGTERRTPGFAFQGRMARVIRAETTGTLLDQMMATESPYLFPTNNLEKAVDE